MKKSKYEISLISLRTKRAGGEEEAVSHTVNC